MGRHAAEEYRAIGFRYELTYWLEGTGRALIELVATAGKAPAAGRAEAPQGLSEKAGDMPTYLPTYVPGVTNERWEAMLLQRARECAEECVAISEGLQKPDELFSGRLLLARIEAAEGHGEVATERLNGMLEEAVDDENSWQSC